MTTSPTFGPWAASSTKWWSWITRSTLEIFGDWLSKYYWETTRQCPCIIVGRLGNWCGVACKLIPTRGRRSWRYWVAGLCEAGHLFMQTGTGYLSSIKNLDYKNRSVQGIGVFWFRNTIGIRKKIRNNLGKLTKRKGIFQEMLLRAEIRRSCPTQ